MCHFSLNSNVSARCKVEIIKTFLLFCSALPTCLHHYYYLYCCKKNVKRTTERKFCPHTGIISAHCSSTPNPNPIMMSSVLNPPYNGDNDLWNDIQASSIKKIVIWVACRKFSYSTCFFFFFPWYNSTYPLIAMMAMELANPTLNHSWLTVGLCIMLWNKLISMCVVEWSISYCRCRTVKGWMDNKRILWEM